jgi:hypothetical protein
MARPVTTRPQPVPYPYGVHGAADNLGGMAAPLLGGFAVTLLGLVLQVEKDMRWPGLALFLFAAGAVLFLQVVQLHARARAFVTSLRQALEWYEDAEDPERIDRVRAEVIQHDAAWRFWVRRARACYNLGIILLLCGSAVLLVPAKSSQLDSFRIAAITVILTGVLFEVLAMLNVVLGRRRRPPGRMRRLLNLVAPARPPAHLS